MAKSASFYLSRARCASRLLSPGAQMPIYLLMFVTSKCNAACEHCFYWRELNENIRKELKLDEFEKLARSLGPMLQVTLTGGSPELRPDLPEVTEVFVRNCQPNNLTFCMLGYATEKIVAYAERILTDSPDQKFTFAVSLDGLGEEHDKLRHLPKSFDNATNTLRALGKMKKHFPNLRLSVGMTVHALNFQSAERTAKWVRSELPIDVLKPILVRGDPLNRETLDRVCVNTYLNVISEDRKWVNGTRGRNFSPMDYVVNCKESVSRDVIKQISTTGKSPVTCSGGRETAVVYPTGEVGGCELRDTKLGDIRDVDYDFAKIWFGNKADDFRKTAGAEPECKSCYHHCFLSPPIFRTPKIWPKLLATAWSIYRNNPSN